MGTNKNTPRTTPETVELLRQQHITERPQTASCLLLEKLPIELRLIIYEDLLRSQENIAISPVRKQQAIDEFRCQWCKTTHMTPPYAFWRPCVTILRTCKQINLEATKVLYRQNKFLISFPLYRPLQVTKFFLYDLRQSTLFSMRSVTFRAGCSCPWWVGSKQKEWKTTGKALSNMVFPGCVIGSILPSPKRIKEAHKMIKVQLFNDGRVSWNPCYDCSRNLGWLF